MVKHLAPSELLVKDVTNTEVVFLREEDTLPFVFDIFHRCRISGAPVINQKGEYSGLITKSDLVSPTLLSLINEGQPLDKLTVKQFMPDTPIVAVLETSTLREVTKLILQKRIHRVFVKDKNDKITGVVSTFDIVKGVALSWNKHVTLNTDDTLSLEHHPNGNGRKSFTPFKSN